jgi:hypothetical protein
MTTLFVACSQDKNPDITIDQNSGDTLQIIKRYPSKKVKEIVLYKDNTPSTNLGFTEKGDTLKIPKAIYVKADNSIFIFLPGEKNFRRIMVSIINSEKPDSNGNRVINIEPKFTRSFDIPITPEMIIDKEIQGVILTHYHDNKPMEVWPFKMIID